MTATVELGAGPELDRAVALAMGWQESGYGLWEDGTFQRPYVPSEGMDERPRTPHRTFAPSRDWRALGEVIERFRVWLSATPSGRWTATISRLPSLVLEEHADPKVAVCRCVVRAAGKGGG